MPRTKTNDAGTAPPPRVIVVGGGLAGLTAALKLRQRGFAVTLYEAQAELGGNLASNRVRGVFHDVYPHMFCNWYANFWTLFEDDLGLVREDRFAPRMGVRLLNPSNGQFQELQNATTLQSSWANLTSGVMPASDMFLLGFTMLDIASHPFNLKAGDQFSQLDVNGYIYSRGYATEDVAKMQNYILMTIWSLQSEVTSAISYQDFVKHTLTFPEATPFCWLLKGDLYSNIIRPLEQKLLGLGCDIRRQFAGRAGRHRPRRHRAGRPSRSAAYPGPGSRRLCGPRHPGPGALQPGHGWRTGPPYRRPPAPAFRGPPPARRGHPGHGRLFQEESLKACPTSRSASSVPTATSSALDISQLWTGDPNPRGPHRPSCWPPPTKLRPAGNQRS